MKMNLIKKVVAIALIAGFSQFSLADNESANKLIAGVLVDLNHFPSDADRGALMAVANDESNGQGFRMIAEAVGNIQHSANAEGKAAMNRIIASDRASAEAKALAEIVLGISHMPSAEAKAALEAML